MQESTPIIPSKPKIIPIIIFFIIGFALGSAAMYILLTNQQNTSNNVNSITVTPSTTLLPSPTAIETDNFYVTLPYQSEDDISSVNEAYSMNPNNPYWGFVHPGVDFMITKSSIPVLAATNGTIVNLEIKKENNQMGWHAGFAIEYNKTYSVCYNLETFGHSDEVEQMLRENLFINTGDYVERGQVIANLIYGGSGAHIDFGVCTGGGRPCPEPYFTNEARESVMRLIHKTQPNWPMCAD